MKKMINIILILSIFSIQLAASEEIRQKKFSSQDDYLFLDMKLGTILERVNKNDELVIINETNVGIEKFFYVQTYTGRKGYVRNILADKREFPIVVRFKRVTKSEIVNDLKERKKIASIVENDDYEIEERCTYKDSSDSYYLCQDGYYIKISAYDEFDMRRSEK